MRDPNVPMAQAEILREFVAQQSEFAIFAPPDSAYQTASIHGGMFVYASDDPEPGVRVRSAFPAREHAVTDLAARHFVRNYASAVEVYQQSPAAQLDSTATQVVYDAGRELLSEDHRVLGGFVLMAANRTLSRESKPYLTAFVVRALSDALRFSIRDDALRDGEKDKTWRSTLRGAATNHIDEARLQNYSLHLMSGLFPPAKRIHKHFGFRRRPR